MADPHTKATLRDWSRSIPATALLASTMITCDLPLRAVNKLLGRASLVDAGHQLAKVMWQAFALTGATLDVVGREHVDPNERYLIVANHQGFSDVIVIATALRELQPRYVAKRELAHGWPSISYLITASGSAVIDRKHPEAAIAEIERLGRDAKREGWNVAIFPEGTRAKDGVARTWKPRGTKALLEATRPCKVLPVSLVGGSELFAHNALPFKAGVHMRCHVHPPIEPPEPNEDFAAWLEAVRQTVASVL
ncbi:lysophospholipid acyltransferase family protein [Enhygromyxa salina]|uniref:1-acyl-sn-glycerol-3-phosphate acyltransferase n=1 Tax=Enhygromyxa salina TaxID=215803 RepID=A0A2S9YP05_9BACT|nr:lysophospholipid acyltransferase family protein [Enhygromyxa salina]PRQ06808.1 1-acyl-sn-glycerol-3-phosphate acyltransferase [Enhygromyxa salina]